MLNDDFSLFLICVKRWRYNLVAILNDIAPSLLELLDLAYRGLGLLT